MERGYKEKCWRKTIYVLVSFNFEGSYIVLGYEKNIFQVPKDENWMLTKERFNF